MRRNGILFTRLGELRGLETLLVRARNQSESATAKSLDRIIPLVQELDESERTSFGTSVVTWGQAQPTSPNAIETLVYLTDLVTLEIEGELNTLAAKRDEWKRLRERGLLIDPRKIEQDLAYVAAHGLDKQGARAKSLSKVRAAQLAHKREVSAKGSHRGPSGVGSGGKRGNSSNSGKNAKSGKR